jgi:oligosaccharide repeat unit polymerase
VLFRVLAFIIIIVLMFFLYPFEAESISSSFIFVNFTILLFCSFSLIMSPVPSYSMYNSTFLFSFIFFGLAPLLERLNGISYWGGGELPDASYVSVSWLALGFILLMSFVYTIFFGKVRPNVDVFRFALNYRIKERHAWGLIALSFFSAMLILFYNKFNFTGVFLRGGEGVERYKLSVPVRLIYYYIVKPIPVIALIFYLAQYKVKWFDVNYLILLVLALVFCFPTSIPRFLVAALYLPLAILLVEKMRRPFIYPVVILASVFTIFPFLDKFRSFNNSETLFDFNFNFLLKGHLDSFQNTVRLIEADLVSYGESLFGILLFWFPRSIWADKPIGSGSFMAQEVGLNFDNIGLSLLGEGYLSFGYAGVFIFSILWVYFSFKLDMSFWKKGFRGNHNKIYYLISIGMVFLILRGDLISAFAYSVGLYLCVRLTSLVSEGRNHKLSKIHL